MDCEHGVHFSSPVVGIGALVVGFEVLILLFSGFYSDFDLAFPKLSVVNNVSRNFNSNLWSRIIPQGYWPQFKFYQLASCFLPPFSVRSTFLPTSHSRFVR